jgi:lipopolysaccharide exporter
LIGKGKVCLEQKRNYWIRSGTYTLMQRAATFLFGFGSYLFMVRYFSVPEFGVWALYIVVSTAVEMSRSAFIQNAFVKFLNEDDADKDGLFSASLFLNLVSTIVFIIAIIALMPVMKWYWNSAEVLVLIGWYCVTSLVLVPFTQFNYLEQANHSFRGVFWATAIRQGAFFLFVMICFFFIPGLPLVYFAAGQTFCALLGALVSWVLARRHMPARFFLDWVLVRRLFKFGKYILGTGVTSTLGKSADQAILGGVDKSMTALYNSGVRILNFVEVPVLAISSIVYPKIAEKAGKEGPAGVADLYEKSVATILALILPVVIFVVIFPEFVLMLTAGDKYLEAATILRILSASSIMLPFNVQIGSACEVINKPQISFYINLISNLLNVIFNIFMIKYFGMLGAAITFAVTLFFIFVVGQYYMHKLLNTRLYQIVIRVGEFYVDRYRFAMGYLKGKQPKAGL